MSADKDLFVRLAHGSGGVEMLELLDKIIFSRVPQKFKTVEGGIGIDRPDDGALIPISNGFLVFTVDSYTINPPIFPGGNIGMLAVSGTINDIVMMGGRPIALVDAIIVEEGFPLSDLQVIADSMIDVLRAEGVPLVGGDFKVMPRGQLDKIVVTVAGLGIAEKPIIDSPQPGDKIIVTDYIGEHGAMVMVLQLGLRTKIEEAEGEFPFRSDAKPLTKLLELFSKFSGHIHAARDPTRGGLAGVLNEWASSSGNNIVVYEDALPIRPVVRKYSEMLGIDPIYLASEGVAVISVPSNVAEDVVEHLKRLGFENARVIGEVREATRIRGKVLLKTSVGGFRFIEPPHGEIVPRIC